MLSWDEVFAEVLDANISGQRKVCMKLVSFLFYFDAEEGLYCVDKKSSEVLDFMFLRLHNLQDSTNVKNITKVVHNNLTPKLPSNLKINYT